MAETPEEKSMLQTISKYSWILVGIVALIIVGIFYSRWQEDRDIEERAAEQQREHARQVVEAFGGNSFDILNFYAAPAAIHRGDSAELCYGVSNAKSVTVDPKPLAGVWPALSRCVAVEPEKTTTYTLTAVDATGQKKTSTVTVEVQ